LLTHITLYVILKKMIVTFKDEGTEDVFDGRNTKKARKACPQNLWRVAFRKLDQINQAAELNDLRVPPGNRLEELRGGDSRLPLRR
jgi:toxin HigB-1